MPNLKDLKNRIQSVKSTQKITRAMRVVSAAKLKKAREKAESADPYAVRMDRMLKTLASNITGDDAPKLLKGNGKDKMHLIVVVSSDRGLCGAFNTHIIKQVKQKISYITGAGQDYKLFCIGKKGIEQLSRLYSAHMVEKIEGLTKSADFCFDDAKNVAQKIISMFESDEFDVCHLYYNKFYSAISQKPVLQQIIPLDMSSNSSEEESEKNSDAVYEFEPDESAILAELLPKNISVQVFHALLESIASEHAARMTAMDNATRNAGEMINKLTLVYNRTRQANITKELIEIISGAEAV